MDFGGLTLDAGEEGLDVAGGGSTIVELALLGGRPDVPVPVPIGLEDIVPVPVPVPIGSDELAEYGGNEPEAGGGLLGDEIGGGGSTGVDNDEGVDWGGGEAVTVPVTDGTDTDGLVLVIKLPVPVPTGPVELPGLEVGVVVTPVPTPVPVPIPVPVPVGPGVEELNTKDGVDDGARLAIGEGPNGISPWFESPIPTKP